MKYPASIIQQQFWLLQQFSPNSSAYNIPTVFHIRGEVHPATLRKCVNEIIRQHQIFQTTFTIEGGTLNQVISHCTIDVPTISTINSNLSVNSKECMELIEREIACPFDMSEGPLIRVSLLPLAETKEHLLIIVMHHTISDLETMALFSQELSNYYREYQNNKSIKKPSVVNQYTEFSLWQNEWIKSDEFRGMLSFWKKELEYQSGHLNLPTDRKRPDKPSTNGTELAFEISPQLTIKLKEFCQQHNINIFTSLLAVYYVLLHRYSRQPDIIVGVPFTNRRNEISKGVMGCFANITPIPFYLSDDTKFIDVIQGVRKKLLLSHRNQEVPFEMIVKEVKPIRNANINALFQVGFTVEPEIKLEIDEVKIEKIDAYRGSPQLDIFSIFRISEENIYGRFEYSTDLFDKKTMELFADNYLTLLKNAITDVEIPISALEISHEPPSNIALPHLKKEIKELEAISSDELRIAISANFTCEPIEPCLHFWMSKLNIPCTIDFAPYNQIFQQILDPNSLLSKNPNGINVVILRLEDWRGDQTQTEASHKESILRNTEDFLRGIQTASERSPSASFIVILTPVSPLIQSNTAVYNFYKSTESNLCESLQALPGIYAVSSIELLETYPVDNYYQPLGETVGHIPYTDTLFVALSTMIARRLYSIKSSPAKVIAVDCDNTLWDGVVGEDGPRGVSIASSHKVLQELLIDQKSKGRLICLCSKNEEKDVKEVFDMHPDMVLKWSDVSFSAINWNPKSVNLRSLSSQINVGIDSFIFIDDNPVECAEVKSNCPSIFTIHIPDDNTVWPEFLKHIWVFDQLKSTSEDKKRAKMYETAVKRESFLSESHSFEDFLQGLNLQITIKPLIAENIPRVAQLTQRTNQFNFTTIRKTEKEIQALLNDTSPTCFTTHVSDRFGDYGLVGVIIFNQLENRIITDIFLLSCRTMGKGVEHAMVSDLGRIAVEKNIGTIEFYSTTSDRNLPARMFLNTFDMECITEQNDDITRVVLTPEQAQSCTFQPEIFKADESSDTKAKQSSSPVQSALIKQYESLVSEISLLSASPDSVLKEIKAESKALKTIRSIDSTAPSSEIEQKIAEIWKDTLNRDTLGINSNFFDLGGKSFLIPQIIIALKNKHDIEISIVDMFQHPTVALLASHIDSDDTSSVLLKAKSSAEKQKAALAASGKKNPFARLRNQR